MTEVTTDRGFRLITRPGYETDQSRGEKRLVQESSAIGDYEDSFDRPGSSFLWIGEHHHLSREEVEQLVLRLQQWLNTGRLF